MEGNIISVGLWGLEEGDTFSQKKDGILRKVVLIYDGGFKSLTANYSESNYSDSDDISKKLHKMLVESPKNIVKNADFSEGMNFWKNWCQAEVVSSGNDNYVIVSNRGAIRQSIEQDITEQVYVGSMYEVSADVSVKGGDGKKFEMFATFKIENLDLSISYLHVGRVDVTHMQWAKLECSFSLNQVAKSVSFYLEGPSGGVDLLIRRVSISPVFKKFVIKLEHPDEYLNDISGYSKKLQSGMSEVICSLTFKSNLRTYGPYGSEEGKFFSFKTADALISGFHGTSDNYLKSIGFYLKPLRSTGPIFSSSSSLMQILLLNQKPFTASDAGGATEQPTFSSTYCSF